MTKEETARQLNGWKLGNEMPGVMRKLLAGNGLVAVYVDGADMMRLEGALEWASSPCAFVVDSFGSIRLTKCSSPTCQNLGSDSERVIYVEHEAVEATWVISSRIPSSEFCIAYDVKGESIFCRGIVLDLADMFAGPKVKEMIFTRKTFTLTPYSAPPRRKTNRYQRGVGYETDPWCDLLYLAGVKPQDWHDVREVIVTMGEMKVTMKKLKKAPADMIGEIENGA